MYKRQSPKKVEKVDESLLIKWPDGHDSIIPLSKILECGTSRYPEHIFWPELFTPNRFEWNDFLDDIPTAIDALKNLISYGVIILQKAPKESNSLEKLSKRLGPIHETLFERIHNVTVTGHVYNVAHTSKGLPPHNDFASYKSQPSIQALHMLENECEGGESIVVDGWKLLEDLRNDHPDFFRILQEFDVPFREFDEKNETFANEPIVRLNSQNKIIGFRFSNQLMQMINPQMHDVDLFYLAYHELCNRLNSEKYKSKFRLKSGHILLVYGHRVLHGRCEFTPNGRRHLQDAYYEMDNVENNLVLYKNQIGNQIDKKS